MPAGVLKAPTVVTKAPQVFAERVQPLLPFLVGVQGSSGVPFLLPALLQLVGPDGDEAGGAQGRQAWLVHLSDEKVRTMCHCTHYFCRALPTRFVPTAYYGTSGASWPSLCILCVFICLR